jgi:hypothetical protein
MPACISSTEAIVVPAPEPGPITPGIYYSQKASTPAPDRYGTAFGSPRSPGRRDNVYFPPGSEIMPRATSLFQMNSTTSAPIVAVMKPAP